MNPGSQLPTREPCAGWQESGPLDDVDLGLCTAGLPDGELTRWFAPTEPVGDPEPWTAWFQAVELHPDEQAAAAVFADLRDSYVECADVRIVSAEQSDITGLGDEAYAALVLVSSEDGDPFGRELAVGLARTGAVVTVVLRQVGQPEAGSPNPVIADLVAAVSRLCETPEGDGCADQPDVHRVRGRRPARPGT